MLGSSAISKGLKLQKCCSVVTRQTHCQETFGQLSESDPGGGGGEK